MSIRNIFIIGALGLVVSFFYSCHPKLNSSAEQRDSEASKQANEIAHEVIITDGHIDFPYHFRDNYGEINEANSKIAIESPKGEFDYARAKAGGLDAPFMSIYIPASYQEKHHLKEKGAELKIEEKRFKEKYNKPIYSNVAKVADHIDQVVKIAGIDYVGLGSDFDGVGDSLPQGLKDVSQYPNLIDELLRRGYSREEIGKICYKNVWRVWNAVQDYAQNH